MRITVVITTSLGKQQIMKFKDILAYRGANRFHRIDETARNQRRRIGFHVLLLWCLRS